MSRYIDADDIDNITVFCDSRGCLTRIEAPTADVAPVVHASWVAERNDFGLISGKCNNCKKFSGLWQKNDPYNYCPYCGAKMDEEEKDDGKTHLR